MSRSLCFNTSTEQVCLSTTPLTEVLVTQGPAMSRIASSASTLQQQLQILINGITSTRLKAILFSLLARVQPLTFVNLIYAGAGQFGLLTPEELSQYNTFIQDVQRLVAAQNISNA